MAGTTPSAWEDPSLVQLWGPRFSAYVVAGVDVPVFSLGRLSDDPDRRRFCEDLASRLEGFLDGRTMEYGEAGRALGMNPNMLRYAAPTGRVLIRWEGAGRPTIWTVPAPSVDRCDARLELARRYLHVLGPGTPATFAEWAGIKPAGARTAFASLTASVMPVRTPIGDGWILAEDEQSFRGGVAAGTVAGGTIAAGTIAGGTIAAGTIAGARLLPSGDAYFLFHGGRDRELLVPEAERRRELWTSAVWPGALLVGNEVVGTWRRAGRAVTIRTWRPLSDLEREAVEREAASLPLPGVREPAFVSWVE